MIAKVERPTFEKDGQGYVWADLNGKVWADKDMTTPYVPNLTKTAALCAKAYMGHNGNLMPTKEDPRTFRTFNEKLITASNNIEAAKAEALRVRLARHDYTHPILDDPRTEKYKAMEREMDRQKRAAIKLPDRKQHPVNPDFKPGDLVTERHTGSKAVVEERQLPKSLRHTDCVFVRYELSDCSSWEKPSDLEHAPVDARIDLSKVENPCDEVPETSFDTKWGRRVINPAFYTTFDEIERKKRAKAFQDGGDFIPPMIRAKKAGTLAEHLKQDDLVRVQPMDTPAGKQFFDQLVNNTTTKTYPMCADCGEEGPNCDC